MSSRTETGRLLDSFLFSFPFSPLKATAVPLPSNARYANFKGSSFEHDVNLAQNSECSPSPSNESSSSLDISVKAAMV